MYAMKSGVSCCDTAWGYHGRCSETAMGKAIGAYPRESRFLTAEAALFGREGIFDMILDLAGSVREPYGD